MITDPPLSIILPTTTRMTVIVPTRMQRHIRVICKIVWLWIAGLALDWLVLRLQLQSTCTMFNKVIETMSLKCAVNAILSNVTF